MALTEGQCISLFEILTVPYSATIEIPKDPYFLESNTYVSGSPEKQLQVKIMQRLLLLSAEEEARLLRYIDSWDNLSTNTVTISGSVGGLSGVDYNPNIELERIASRVKIIIPVLQYHREITTQSISSPLTISAFN